VSYPYYLIVYELEGYESSDLSGTNVFLLKTADASFNPSTAYRLIDGNYSSAWNSTTAPPYAWFGVDCANPVEIGSFRLKPAWSVGGGGIFFAADFVLEYSHDDEIWTVLSEFVTINADQWQEYTEIQYDTGGNSRLIDGFKSPLIDSRRFIQ